MKNQFKFIHILAGSILTVAVFALAFGAFPQHAQAYGYYGYGASDYSDCYYPNTYYYSNGQGHCSNQSVSYAPTYSVYPTYPTQIQYQPLSVTCYPNSSSVSTGASVQWVASPMGGDGSFSYNWSGTDGLSGTGQTAYVNYNNPGTKTGSVTVYSAGQSVNASCSNFVTVYAGVNYNYNPAPIYPNYGYNYQSYSPLSVSCVANTTYASLGTTVTWTAMATGGNGYYQYSWTGTDGIYGQGQTIAYNYVSPGTKYASVTVYSNGQTITQPCSSILNMNVGGGSGVAYNVNYSNQNALDIACYADPASAAVNQPVTWTAEVTRGSGQYTYNWSGSDNLNGSQASAIKFYSTSGLKTAVVSVNSSDGKSGTHACSMTVRGTGSTVTQPAPQQPVQPVRMQGNQNQSAAAFFSFGNIPWGWVAVLIILILFATVMYLLFNKPKI